MEGGTESDPPDMVFNSTFSFEDDANEDPSSVASRLRRELDEFDRRMEGVSNNVSVKAPSAVARPAVPAQSATKRTVSDIKHRGFDVTMRPMALEAQRQQAMDRQDVRELDRFGGSNSDNDD